MEGGHWLKKRRYLSNLEKNKENRNNELDAEEKWVKNE